MKKTIKVKTDHGPLEVSADVFGKFAVHYSTSRVQRQYTVTHIATGKAITYVDTHREAKDLARQLDAAVIEDMTPDRIYSEEYKAFTRAVRSWM